MKITLEVPFTTALQLKKLAADFNREVAAKDPLALALKTEIEKRGIDLTKIKIL